MVKKAGRGTKRVCGSCEAKFYDLNKDPITCPLCGTVFEIEVAQPKPRQAERKVEKPAEEKTEATQEEDVETVSLEDVAASEEANIDIDDDDVLVDLEDDDTDIPDAEDDDTFLETDDEGNDDVKDIVGGPIAGDEEET